LSEINLRPTRPRSHRHPLQREPGRAENLCGQLVHRQPPQREPGRAENLCGQLVDETVRAGDSCG
jgi:hypothetical protein